MILGVLAAVAALGLGADTIVVLGSRSLDLTGDGRAETLTLVGTGPSIDSLGLTFQIASYDRVLYVASLFPITRREGFDGRARVRTAAEQVEFVGRLGPEFFADAKFVSASGFRADLERQAPGRIAEIPGVIARHRAVYEDHSIGRLERAPMSTDTVGTDRIWAEMLAQDRVVFWFSPGGDLVTAIAWSDRDQRFYRLVECC